MFFFVFVFVGEEIFKLKKKRIHPEIKKKKRIYIFIKNKIEHKIMPERDPSSALQLG